MTSGSACDSQPSPDNHRSGMHRSLLPSTLHVSSSPRFCCHDLAAAFFSPMDVTHVALQIGLVRDLVRDETLGLIPPIMWLDDPAGSLTVANDCAHGPNASVFSRNRRLARNSATRLVTDDMNINDALLGAAGSLATFGEKWSWLEIGRAHV